LALKMQSLPLEIVILSQPVLVKLIEPVHAFRLMDHLNCHVPL